MRVVLTIMAGIVALFAGGCAVMLGQSGGIATAALFALALLNGLVILGVWSAQTAWKPAFYVLAAVDMVAMAGMLYAATQSPGQAAAIPLLAAAVIGLKGVLTFYLARKPSP